MITELVVLNSSYVGSRDLWWVDDPEAVKGYHIYRAYDHPSNWRKLNPGTWRGHFWRDQASLEETTYEVKDVDWVDKGATGKWGFKLPETPYSDVVAARPKVANSPDDVKVEVIDITGNLSRVRPVAVIGLDDTVWLPADNSLPPGGAVSDEAQVYTDSVNQVNYSGIQQFKVTYKRLKNYVDIYTAMVRQFYTIVGVNEAGDELHPPGALGSKIVNTQEVDELTWEYAEMINRNQWIFEQVGEPAYILFRRTRGEPCGCTRPESGIGSPRHGCRSCFETGVIGGYYGPYDLLYIPPDTALTRELDEGGGIKAYRESKSYLTNTPIVQDGDLIVRRNGERLVLHGVTYKQPRGVLLQQDFGVELLKPGDTRYLIPINTGLPTLFDPVYRENPLQGIEPDHLKGTGEPLFDVRDQKNKEPWENKVENPIGRTVAFARILGSKLNVNKGTYDGT